MFINIGKRLLVNSVAVLALGRRDREVDNGDSPDISGRMATLVAVTAMSVILALFITELKISRFCTCT